MKLYENKSYIEDILYVMNLNLPWNKMFNSKIVISGATGLIGSFFIDVILAKNTYDNLNCMVYALGRNETKARKRFYKYANDPRFKFVPYDVKSPLILDDIEKVDFVLHLASNTHPLLYATDPIGTITTNIIGVKNLLDFALKHNSSRFVFASSNEIYGENRGDTEFFDEDYCGYINCNTLRAAYPESKRCGEALCQAYKTQAGLDVIIARFTRSYGPTVEASNTRALSQFIKKGLDGEDIVLKSNGAQFFSYTYMADAVSGLLYAMFKGESGEAYNIADEKGDITLRNLAEFIANLNGKRVVFKQPDAVEASGYSRATKARLNGSKLKVLGWGAKYDIKTGIERTISILKSL